MTPIDFSPLDAQIAQQGLMKRHYVYYIFMTLFLLVSFGLSLFLITLGDHILLVIVNTIFFGFLRLQAGFVAHDLSHMQVFKSVKTNRFFASIVWGVCCWASATWWEQYHNAHHKSTNQLHGDPDLDIPFLFDQRQVPLASFFCKHFILPFQHIIFFPGLFTTYLYKFVQCTSRMAKHFQVKVFLELIIIIASITGLSLFVTSYLSWYNALIFLVGHIFIFGVYMGIAFLPNHFGEAIIEEGSPYLRYYQVITTRNISGKRITAFLLGGLNYQVEHHLYPTMPRIALAKARKTVREFCRDQKISYHEVNILVSFMEMFLALRKVARKAEESTAAMMIPELPSIEVGFKKEI